MNETTPKISVIVPVYKAEAYLHRCVDSLLAQTFTDFEILLVDDGSPDRAGEICDEYARKDSRVRVFHKENGGVSSARNMGLDNARGEWICFVDSDDWVDSTLLAHLLAFILKYDTDAILYNFKREISPNEFVVDYTLGKDVLVDVNSAIMCNIFKGQVFNYLFQKGQIELYSLRFDEKIHYAEDVLFIMQYLSNIQCIYYTDQAYYNYNGYNTSATSFISPHYNLNHLLVAEKIFSYYSSMPNLIPFLIDHLNSRYITFLAKTPDLSIFKKIAIMLNAFSLHPLRKYRKLNYQHKLVKLKFYMPVVYLFYRICVR